MDGLLMENKPGSCPVLFVGEHGIGVIGVLGGVFVGGIVPLCVWFCLSH
jgi:hypothetical protein